MICHYLVFVLKIILILTRNVLSITHTIITVGDQIIVSHNSTCTCTIMEGHIIKVLLNSTWISDAAAKMSASTATQSITMQTLYYTLACSVSLNGELMLL